MEIKTDTYARNIFLQDLLNNQHNSTFNEISFESSSFIKTGDYGYFDSRNLHIEGRVDDIVVLGGVNISLGGIENFLRNIYGIRDVCVVAPYGGNLSDLIIS